MKKSERIQKVVEINRSYETMAGNIFSQAQSEYDRNLDQLIQLETYRDEYKKRLKDKFANAISPAELNDYRFFFRSLEEAIEAQQQLIDKLDEKKETTKSEWMSKRQETRKMEKLTNKLQQNENRQEQIREQKELDELSQTLYNFRKSEHTH